MGDSTIYKPSIYNGNGIYKGGGGGSIDIDITNYQGSRGTPNTEGWPDFVSPVPNRVCTQVLYLNSFIGKKITIISSSTNFLIGAQDGTKENAPFNSYSWNSMIEIIVQYGTITIAVKKIDDSNITPEEININVVLTNE